MSRHALPTACALLVLGSGCALTQTTEGTGISEGQVGAIVVGQSTRADVTELLGAPDEIIYSNREHDPLFERAFRYERIRRRTTFLTLIVFSTARTETNGDHVIVFFDDAGIVDDVASRLDRDRPRYGLPWGGD